MKCIFCEKQYKGKSAKRNLDKHLVHCLLNPDGVKYKCSKCNREFDKRHSLNGHLKNCCKIKNRYIRKKKEQKKICEFCGKEEVNYYKMGAHILHCKFNPNYLKNKEIIATANKKGRPHSEETKKKISEIRKEYLKNNPDKVPYLLNHSRNESYPEKYFTELFKNEKIEVIKKFRIGLYELDFSIPDKKINIEIDGEQHYVDNKIVESDMRRNKYLSDLGWITYRIRWSEYQKLNFEEKKKCIENIKNKLNNPPKL